MYELGILTIAILAGIIAITVRELTKQTFLSAPRTVNESELAKFAAVDRRSINTWVQNINMAFAILRRGLKKNKDIFKIARTTVKRVAGRRVPSNRRYTSVQLNKTQNILIDRLYTRDSEAYSISTWLLTRLNISVPTLPQI